MLSPARQRQLAGQSLYVALALALIVAALLPLAPGRIGVPGPDLLTAMTLAWVVRRPAQVPAPTIGAVALLADILLFRPPGLGAAITVVAAETLRRSAHRGRTQGFIVEWLRAAALMALMVLAERTLRTLFLIPPTLAPLPPLGQDILRLIATVGAYPLVVAVLHPLGLRRPSPLELNWPER
ncbi:rod shape-determining protein MreD [Paracoccus solventivorans]|uniref:Rod shape-determining protein MreD n=1 Tax=Paracoccus solventivorans TaxID=53463 RepID=A0A1M7D9J1_9RHOB|nr:hypothetical protein [Paracoccus solventivorans]SHL76088.1 rod shape-determining protein MreD [Paracoccus solventivorans]